MDKPSVLHPTSDVAGESMAFRILIADDHQDVRNHLKTTLEAHRGWSVCALVGDGQEAVQKTRETKPDLIILDFAMPVMDGIHAAQEILRASPTFPVVLYTNHVSHTLELEAKKVGVRQVVSKTQLIQLLSAIEALAERKANPAAPEQAGCAEGIEQIPSAE
jgi:CheY-like chemotaxis protein